MRTNATYSLSVIIAALLAAGSILLIVGYAMDAPRVETIFVLGDNFFAAAAILTCLWALIQRDSPSADIPSSSNDISARQNGWIVVLIVIIHVGGVILRLIAPGTSILTWMVAPLWIFVVPGLTFARLLMPSVRVTEQIAFAPPLSIGLQVIGVMWLAWLKIPITIPVLLALNGALTLVGLLIALRATSVRSIPDTAPP